MTMGTVHELHPDETRAKLEPDDAFRYITSGHGKFTLVGQTASFTYQTGQNKDDDGKLSPVFVRVLSGPNNESDYQYIGFLGLNDLTTLVAGRKGRPNAPSFKALSWWLRAYITHNPNLSKAEVWHEGTCCVCGRTLTRADSIARGIGPKCLAGNR
jgi:hypothetical protein